MWQSEDNLGELVITFHMGPKDQTLVLRLGGRDLYPLSHLPPLLLNKSIFTLFVHFLVLEVLRIEPRAF